LFALRQAGALEPVLHALLLGDELRRLGIAPEQLTSWRHERWGARVEQRFIQQRQRFERVSYFELGLKSRGEATELYHQLCNQECTFEVLLDRYVPTKPGKPKRGLHVEVSVDGLPKLLRKKLRKSKPGLPVEPLVMGQATVLLQLIDWHEPKLDDSIRSQLEREIEDEWLQQELLRRLQSPSSSEVPTPPLEV
jgi:hypothetical protein